MSETIRQQVERMVAAAPVTMPQMPLARSGSTVRPVGLGWEIAPYAGQAADFATTAIAIRSGRFVERNPLLAHVTGDLAITAAVKLGIALVQHAFVKKLDEAGYGRLARLASAASFASGAIPAGLNLASLLKGKS